MQFHAKYPLFDSQSDRGFTFSYVIQRDISLAVRIVKNNGACCLPSRQNRQGGISSQLAEIDGCFPEWCLLPFTSLPCWDDMQWSRWLKFRWLTRQMVEHRYFEWFILLTVLVSSLVLVSVGKLQILLLCFHTFLTEVVGRSCYNINTI